MDARITQVIEQLERQLDKRLAVAEMAAALGLSPSRFAHLFRASTGMSPVQFFRRLRLERARALLESTTLTVSEVRTLVGGSDASHFARDYRARHGLCPSDSRDARKNGTLPAAPSRPPSDAAGAGESVD